MIPLSTSLCQSDTPESTENSPWQRELARAIKDPRTLLGLLDLKPSDIPGGIDPRPGFPLRVPRGYVARMGRGDPLDPLLMQVLPRGLETAPQPGFVADPVGDTEATVIPGLLHKYHGRVLLITTGVCPVHCRYCFRRHFPYPEHRPEDRHWQAAVDYIAARPDINEVILSGGDPLSLGTTRLAQITQALHPIPHLRRLRLHSRVPVVLPERIDPALLQWLGELPWQTVLVIHANHANEMDTSVVSALASLRQQGITLLNQAVLLKGVNDTLEAQCALSETLFHSGVLPYYLHLLDPVHGAGHFDISHQQGATLISALSRRLPGFLVPRLVREQAGAPYKLPVGQTQTTSETNQIAHYHSKRK